MSKSEIKLTNSRLKNFIYSDKMSGAHMLLDGKLLIEGSFYKDELLKIIGIAYPNGRT